MTLRLADIPQMTFEETDQRIDGQLRFFTCWPRAIMELIDDNEYDDAWEYGQAARWPEPLNSSNLGPDLRCLIF